VKLHRSGPIPGSNAANTFTGYGDDYVMVNGQRHEASLVVLPEKIIPWPAQGFDTLSAENFVFLKNLNVEIVLLGTGTRQRFPHPRLTSTLTSSGIGVEVMDLKAACRTYNILVAEERKVAAALLFR
jgi:uncharacterized protein